MISKQQRNRTPWLSAMILLVCIAVFSISQYYLAQGVEEFELFSAMGAPYAIQIYHGQYWGVVTNSFLHISIAHIVVNIIPFFILASFLERRIKRWKLLLLGIFASVITSLAQLALSNDAGVGLMGINFFFLGYILGKGTRNRYFEMRLGTLSLLTGILVLILSVFLNTYAGFSLGIAAMFFGLIVGSIIGWSTESKNPIIPAALVIITFVAGLSTLINSPWSAEWNYAQGYKQQLNGNFETAKAYYTTALDIQPEHIVVKENLHIIAVEELSDKALEAHEHEDYETARDYYSELLAVDPDNYWAKDNIRRLP